LLLFRPTIDPKQATLLACIASVLLSAHAGLARPAAHSSAAHQARIAHLQAQNKALASGNAVQAAYAFRGTRYVMGVTLPRTATEQYYHGASIPNGQLQPGDLVFFKNTYKHGISHVGIYAGAGKFIHAANAHKGVRMDNLGDSYYRSHYAGARRVLPAQMRLASSLP